MSRFGDVLLRVRPGDVSGSYPVEATVGGTVLLGTMRLDRPTLTAAALDPERYGTHLFERLFGGQVRRAYDLALGQASAEEGRLRVRLWIDEGAPELHAIAWERLYHAPHGKPVPLAVSELTPFSRFSSLRMRPPPPLPTRPIRLLFAVANPEDLPERLKALDVEAEVRTLHRALGPLHEGPFRVTVLPGRSGLPPDLRGALERDGYAVEPGITDLRSLTRLIPRFEVVHLVAHGAFGKGSAAGTTALYLESEAGRWVAERDEDIVDRIAPLDAPAPHLLFLAACETAGAGEEPDPMHPNLGLAAKIVRAGVPAVVAMQRVFPMDLARELTLGFYGSLAEHGLVDVALGRARLALFDRAEVDWATPVLFDRLVDGRLFEPKERANAGSGRETVLRPDPERGVIAEPATRAPAPVPRRPPIRVLPRPFPGLLGRGSEIAAATEAVERGEPVGFFGQDGLGKSVLLRTLAHARADLDGSAEVEGIVHYDARGRTVDDALQYLFESLHDLEVRYEPGEEELRDLLRDRRVVVEIDDLDVDRDEVQRLLNAAPACRFVLAARHRNLWEGQALQLEGLPPDAALALFERELGRPLSADAAPVAASLCRALEGRPLQILQAAALARGLAERGAPFLDELGRIAAAPGPAGALGAAVAADLSEDERRVLEILSALGGAPIRPEHLEALTGMADAGPVLAALEGRRLAASASPAYRATDPALPGMVMTLEVEGWRDRLTSYFLEWTERHRDEPGRLLESADPILATADAAERAGRGEDFLRLSRAAESGLVVGRRWGTWRARLRRQLATAEALGRDGARAWALHELGSCALALGEFDEARTALAEAARLREALGDQAGADLSRQNLEQVPDATPPDGEEGPEEQPEPEPGPEPGPGPGPGPPDGLGRFLRPFLITLGVVAAVAGGALLVPRLLDRDPAPSVSLDPERVDFGSVPLGEQREEVVRLVNTGDTELRLEVVGLDPPTADVAFDASDCGPALGVGVGCDIRFAFRPAATGPVETELVILDDAPGSPHLVPIRGEGVAKAGVAAVRLEPPGIDFGPQAPGTTVTESLEVLSTGDADVSIATVDLEPTEAFRVVAEDCSGRTLPAGERCTVEVAFSPAAPGRVESALVVQDDTPEGPHRALLVGEGAVRRPDLVVPRFTVRGEPFIDPEGFAVVPVLVVVQNQGEGVAGPFKVATEFVGGPLNPERPFLVAFTADPSELVDGSDGFFPFTVGDLGAGRSVTIAGRLLFRGDTGPATVRVTAIADSCASEEFAEPFCRVEESDEFNNRSAAIEVALPGLADLVPVKLSEFSVVIQNLGPGDAGGSVLHVFDDGQLARSLEVGPIGAGGEVEVPFDGCFTGLIVVQADAEGTVPETDESNNRAEADVFCD